MYPVNAQVVCDPLGNSQYLEMRVVKCFYCTRVNVISNVVEVAQNRPSPGDRYYYCSLYGVKGVVRGRLVERGVSKLQGSHCCGFEPSLGHMRDKPRPACRLSGVFRGITHFRHT